MKSVLREWEGNSCLKFFARGMEPRYIEFAYHDRLAYIRIVMTIYTLSFFAVHSNCKRPLFSVSLLLNKTKNTYVPSSFLFTPLMIISINKLNPVSYSKPSIKWLNAMRSSTTQYHRRISTTKLKKPNDLLSFCRCYVGEGKPGLKQVISIGSKGKMCSRGALLKGIGQAVGIKNLPDVYKRYFGPQETNVLGAEIIGQARNLYQCDRKYIGAEWMACIPTQNFHPGKRRQQSPPKSHL